MKRKAGNILSLSSFSVLVLKTLGKSPVFVLQGFSRVAFFVLYYIVRYRKDVIGENLRNAFPGKPEKELRRIRKLYYRHLSVLFFEALHLLKIKPADASQWLELENFDLVQRYIDDNRDIALTTGHYGNWEMLPLLQPLVDAQGLAVYKPVHNEAMNTFMKSLRERYGAKAVPMRMIIRYLSEYRRNNIRTFTLYIIDQTPHRDEIEYCLRFLNRPAAVFLGPEKIARKWNHVVLYAGMERQGFARYKIKFHLVTDEPDKLPPYEITKRYTRLLEKDILEAPQYWLWSHRRWKYSEKCNSLKEKN